MKLKKNEDKEEYISNKGTKQKPRGGEKMKQRSVITRRRFQLMFINTLLKPKSRMDNDNENTNKQLQNISKNQVDLKKTTT